jgi:hypothetical protein
MGEWLKRPRTCAMLGTRGSSPVGQTLWGFKKSEYKSFNIPFNYIRYDSLKEVMTVYSVLTRLLALETADMCSPSAPAGETCFDNRWLRALQSPLPIPSGNHACGSLSTEKVPLQSF